MKMEAEEDDEEDEDGGDEVKPTRRHKTSQFIPFNRPRTTKNKRKTIAGKQDEDEDEHKR